MTLPAQEPFADGDGTVDGDLLAPPHPSQEGDPYPAGRQQFCAGGTQSAQMCLLEEIPSSTG